MLSICKNIENCKCIFNIFIVTFTLFYIRINNFDIDESKFILNILSSFFIVLEILVKILYLKAQNYDGLSNNPFAGQELNDKSAIKGKQAKFKISTIFQILIQSISSIILTHITVILFGAYPIKNFEETLTFSVLVASLVFIRPLICFGPTAILYICQDWSWSNCSQVQGAFVLLGSWLGAFLIPLDWDRPWQVWPLTCCMGALFGELTASTILFYDRVRKLKKLI